MNAIASRHGCGNLQETLGPHEVGLEAGAKRIATPGNTRSSDAGTAHERIVQEGSEGNTFGQLSRDGAAHHGEDIRQRQTSLREEPIRSTPILKLGTGGGEQSGNGMAAEAKQRT